MTVAGLPVVDPSPLVRELDEAIAHDISALKSLLVDIQEVKAQASECTNGACSLNWSPKR